MTSFAVAFLISLVVAAATTPLVLRLALRFELYDQPDGRKIHREPIPRLGGVAIVLAFFAPVTGLLLVEAGAGEALSNTNQIIGLYIGGILIAALGVYDDLKGAAAVHKFAVQIGVAVLMFSLDYRIDAISNPFGEGRFVLGALAAPVTVLWFVAVMNAVNLIDGLDGLAGGIGLISVSVLFVLAVTSGNVLAAIFCAALAGSLAGFLFFNFNPARIFMGDSGSLFVGFVLAAFSIATGSKGSTTVALVIPMLALGLPLLDTLLAITRRLRKQRPIFSADQDHIHHKLLRSGLSHRQAVLALYGIALVLGAAALIIQAMKNPASWIVVVALAVALFILFRYVIRGPDVRGVTDPFQGRELDRQQLHALIAELGRAETADELVARLDTLARTTDVIAVTITRDERTLYIHARAYEPKELVRGLTRYRLPLVAADGAACHVNLQYADTSALGDLAAIVPWEMAARSLTEALERLAWAPVQNPLPEISDQLQSLAVLPHAPLPKVP